MTLPQGCRSGSSRRIPPAASDILPGRCRVQPHPSPLFFWIVCFVSYSPWSPDSLCTSLPPHTPRSPPGSALGILSQLPSLNALFCWLPATLVCRGPRPSFPSRAVSTLRFLDWLCFISLGDWRGGYGEGRTRDVSSPGFFLFQNQAYPPRFFTFLQGSLFAVAFGSLLWCCL